MSLVDKLELKKGTITQVGVKIEELLEGAERDAQRAHGAATALREHAVNLLQISAAVDQETGKSIPDLETAKLIKKWLSKAVMATENASQHQRNLELSFLGAVAGHRSTHDVLQKMSKQITAKQTEVEKGVENGAVTTDADGNLEAKPGAQRPVGVRPAPTVKAQRQAEETKKKKPVKRQPAKKKVTKKKATTKRKVKAVKDAANS